MPASPVAALPPLTAEKLTEVRGWVTSADRRRDDFVALWDKNGEAFQPKPSTLTKARGRYEISTNVDFRQVEQTKPQLFFATPDVQLTPTSPGRPMPVPMDPAAMTAAPPAPGQPPPAPPQPIPFDRAIAVHQLVLKQVLGPKQDGGVDALRAVQRAITDVLAISGIGWVTVGREAFTRPVEDIDPLTGEPMTVDVPVFERLFMEHSSPAKGIVPSDAVGSDPDDWPYIGKHFCQPVSSLRAEFGDAIPPEFEGTVSHDPHRLRKDEVVRTGDAKLATGVRLWIKATFLDPAERHPLKIRELVLVDGIDEPVRYRDSPYQTFGEDGQLTPDSLVGFPDFPLIVQDAPDSPYVLAQSSMTRPLVDELNTYRAQSIQHRDAGKPVILVNSSKFDETQLTELKAKGSHFIFLPDEDWPVGQPPIIAVNMPGLPRDNYEGANRVESDIERTHALGAPQTGGSNKGRRSATEVQASSESANVRMASLQGRVIDWYCKIIGKLDALVQRYSDSPQWIQVVGEEQAATWQLWDKRTIAGRFLYRIKPDSQLRVDAAADRGLFLQGYNLAAPSPNFDRLELDRDMARRFGWPDKVVRPPQPGGPPPPKVSVTVNLGDLEGPAAPVILEVLEQAGYKVSVQAVNNMMAEKLKIEAQKAAEEAQQAAPRDGSPPRPKGDVAEKAASLDAHQERRTGGIEGIGGGVLQ